MNDRILYISPNFPPLNSSQSISNVYYCMELEKLGYGIIILTAEIPNDHIRYYNDDNQWFKGEFKIKRVGLGLYGALYTKKIIKSENKKKYNAKKRLRKTKAFGMLKNIIKEILFFPDSFIYWTKKSYLIANQLISKYNPSIIITASEPNSTHILGYRLKQKFPKIKWIGYFGDPWSLEPKLNIFQKIRLRRLEKKIICLMDKYVFTTKKTRDLYCKEFDIDIKKTSVFSRGYDPKVYNICSSISLDKNKINFVYTGLIGKNRNILPFFNVIKENKTLLINSKVNFYFVGDMCEELKKKFEEFEFIKLHGIVSFRKSIMFMKEADFLMLFDNNENLQLPAKAFDYLGTTNPIITITSDFTSPLCELMREANRGPIIYNRKNDIEEILKKIINFYNNKQIPDKWRSLNDKYEISNIVLNFAKENLNFNRD